MTIICEWISYELRSSRRGVLSVVVARERADSRVLRRLAFIECFYRMRRTRRERRWRDLNGTVQVLGNTLDITSRIPPRLSESRGKKVTSILAFLRADVSLYCLCTNDNGTLSSPPLHTRAYTRASAPHAHRVYRFRTGSLRRRFRTAPPP